jgi:hypothetical protein
VSRKKKPASAHAQILFLLTAPILVPAVANITVGEDDYDHAFHSCCCSTFEIEIDLLVTMSIIV